MLLNFSTTSTYNETRLSLVENHIAQIITQCQVVASFRQTEIYIRNHHRRLLITEILSLQYHQLIVAVLLEQCAAIATHDAPRWNFKRADLFFTVSGCQL